jgi:predicted O-methyltransferase YrrM
MGEQAIGTLWFNLKYVIKHPEFVWQYLTRVSAITTLMGISRSTVRDYLREYSKVNADIEAKLKKLPYLGWMDKRKNELIYALVRILKPEIAVETGVGVGASSAIILRAMSMNDQGQLFSIDAGQRAFDGITFPSDKPIGFIVPKEVRDRWHLTIEFSRDVLEPLLSEVGEIDLFFHDSEHSYDNMMFEFNATWRHLRPAGVLIADDIERNSAFDDFVKAKRIRAYRKLYAFGVVKKKFFRSSPPR